MARKDRHSSFVGWWDGWCWTRLPARGIGPNAIGITAFMERRCDQSDSSTLSGGDREPEDGPFRWVIAGDRLIFEGFDPGSE
jgi:hypothetical protein